MISISSGSFNPLHNNHLGLSFFFIVVSFTIDSCLFLVKIIHVCFLFLLGEQKTFFFFISISRLIYNHYYYDSHSLFLMENINQIHSISIFTYSNNNKILSNTHTHTHSKPIMIHHNWHEYIEWIQTNELIIKQTDQNEWIYAWIILEDFVLFCYCPFCLPDFFSIENPVVYNYDYCNLQH